MLNKFFYLLTISSSILFAFDKKESGEIHFLSKEVSLENNYIVAHENSTVLFEDKYMKSDSIVYDQKKREIEFFGNVSLVEKGLYFFIGDYAKINLDGNATIKNMFLYHKPRHIWLYSNESNATEDKFSLKNTFLSSCRSENPDWGFYIEEGFYDKHKQVFELYNILLYATDIPILYIPYLNFSINRERKSGLLVPKIGLSATEGLYFSQPIYYVPNWWSDYEISPQIRTSRGGGAYAKYRFADSPYSKGEISGGLFYETDSYAKEYQLSNMKHYGIDFYYKSDNVFSGIKDSFLIDIKYLNDVSYISLNQADKDVAKSKSTSSNNNENEISNLVESRINYQINNNNHTFGIYNRYVIDTSQSNNHQTLQTLPYLKYHYGLNSFSSSFLYSLDTNYKNFYRPEGATANLYDLTMPISLHWNLLDNYLKLKITENFYTSYIDFSNTNLYSEDKNFYLRHYHQIELFTDLGRKNSDGTFHSIDFGANLILSDIEYKSGFYTPSTDSENCEVGNPCEFQREKNIDSSFELKFAQHLHNKNGKDIFYHKFQQPVIVEDGQIVKLDTLENEFKLFFDNELSLYNSLNYSFDDGKILKLSSTVEYDEKDYKYELSHFLNHEKDENPLEFVSTEASMKLNGKYSLFGNYSYDIVKDTTKSWSLGYNMSKRCWNYKLQYKQEDIPISTNIGAETQRNSMLYFLIELYPLGGLDHEFH